DAARTLFRSLQAFRSQPEYLQVWPAHGAGSACGKSMSAVPHSTIGYELRFNWAFGVTDEGAFVEQVLAGQPEPPEYFAEMKRRNREGPAILGGVREPPHREPGDLADILAAGGILIDVRAAADFAAGHVPGTLSLPLNKSFNTWAGWLLPYDIDLYLLGDGSKPGWLYQAVHDLAMIGLDQVAGWFDLRGIELWKAGHGPLETITQMSPEELDRRIRNGEVSVIDVRGRSEWEAGHIPGVPNIPLGTLPDNLDQIPLDRPVVLHCQGGGRSSIGAALLQKLGIDNVANLTGGFGRWKKENRETT
ncbi:MAG: rhodanese-like domain-containing protein, partial [Gemmatimonadales bacterium]